MSDTREVRIGVVGRGFGARAVAPAYEGAGCTVVDIVSPRDDAAVQALFDRADVDLISVHSPPFMHRDHVRRAIEAGQAVLCDKPFGRDALEAEEMYELAHDAGVLNLVNYEFRAHPILSKLRDFDAVRQQAPIFPLATFADGLAAARVMDQLVGIR